MQFNVWLINKRVLRGSLISFVCFLAQSIYHTLLRPFSLTLIPVVVAVLNETKTVREHGRSKTFNNFSIVS